MLHVRIIGAAATLGSYPGDVLGRILDVAGLAVDAVLEVDPELRLSFFLDHFVDADRAVALRGLGVFRQISGDGNVRIAQFQMAGLVLVVVGVRQEHRGRLVER